MSISEDMEKLRVGEEARGEEAAISKAKLVRKDIKLPKDFEKKLAFILYDVFSEEVRSPLAESTANAHVCMIK